MSSSFDSSDDFAQVDNRPEPPKPKLRFTLKLPLPQLKWINDNKGRIAEASQAMIRHNKTTHNEKDDMFRLYYYQTWLKSANVTTNYEWFQRLLADNTADYRDFIQDKTGVREVTPEETFLSRMTKQEVDKYLKEIGNYSTDKLNKWFDYLGKNNRDKNRGSFYLFNEHYSKQSEELQQAWDEYEEHRGQRYLSEFISFFKRNNITTNENKYVGKTEFKLKGYKEWIKNLNIDEYTKWKHYFDGQNEFGENPLDFVEWSKKNLPSSQAIFKQGLTQEQRADYEKRLTKDLDKAREKEWFNDLELHRGDLKMENFNRVVGRSENQKTAGITPTNPNPKYQPSKELFEKLDKQYDAQDDRYNAWKDFFLTTEKLRNAWYYELYKYFVEKKGDRPGYSLWKRGTDFDIESYRAFEKKYKDEAEERRKKQKEAEEKAKKLREETTAAQRQQKIDLFNNGDDKAKAEAAEWFQARQYMKLNPPEHIKNYIAELRSRQRDEAEKQNNQRKEKKDAENAAKKTRKKKDAAEAILKENENVLKLLRSKEDRIKEKVNETEKSLRKEIEFYDKRLNENPGDARAQELKKTSVEELEKVSSGEYLNGGIESKYKKLAELHEVVTQIQSDQSDYPSMYFAKTQEILNTILKKKLDVEDFKGTPLYELLKVRVLKIREEAQRKATAAATKKANAAKKKLEKAQRKADAAQRKQSRRPRNRLNKDDLEALRAKRNATKKRREAWNRGENPHADDEADYNFDRMDYDLRDAPPRPATKSERPFARKTRKPEGYTFSAFIPGARAPQQNAPQQNAPRRHTRRPSPADAALRRLSELAVKYGVEKTTVRTVYKELALKLHPDKTKDESKHADMRVLTEVKRILTEAGLDKIDLSPTRSSGLTMRASMKASNESCEGS
jgi:hypothetical protein